MIKDLKILIIGNSHGRDTFNIFDLNNEFKPKISVCLSCDSN